MTNASDCVSQAKCLIWPDAPAETVTLDPSSAQFSRVVEGSRRAGGDYLISADADRMLSPDFHRVDDSDRARITTILVDRRAKGEEWPTVTLGLINQAIAARPLTVHARAERLLTFIGSQCKTINQACYIGHEELNSLALAWTESASDGELAYVWEYIMDETKWIRPADKPLSCIITPAGHARIAELSTRTDSAQAFVARWFEKSMDDICDKAIAPAIMAAGYVPYRIEEADSLDPITDQIIAEIRRSRFLVSDFTHGDDGARGGVYLEIGISLGQDIPVIFTAERGTKPHFDISPYPHIFWNRDNLPAFRAALTNRIMNLKELVPGPRLT